MSSAEADGGTGPGVTWYCAVDTEIADRRRDCSPTWWGGDIGNPTAASSIHVNGQSGAVQWDVTQDVQAGVSSWLLKKTKENLFGEVLYYSKEGAKEAGDMALAPRIILKFQ